MTLPPLPQKPSATTFPSQRVAVYLASSSGVTDHQPKLKFDFTLVVHLDSFIESFIVVVALVPEGNVRDGAHVFLEVVAQVVLALLEEFLEIVVEVDLPDLRDETLAETLRDVDVPAPLQEVQHVADVG